MRTDFEVELQRTAKYLRRRVPPGLVADLTQSTALEALEHRSNDVGPGFIVGIARHEAADAYRRRQRERRRDDVLRSSPSSAPPVAEATAQLGEVLAFVAERPSLGAPLRWIVEEFAGSSFEEIARREGIEPATVRKRVSRLRRLLTLAFAATLLALTTVSAMRAPSQFTQPTPSTEAAPASLDGSWIVVDVHSDDPRAFALRGARIVVSGDRATISALGTTTVVSITPRGDGFVVAGTPETITIVSSHDGTIELRSARGSIELQRSY